MILNIPVTATSMPEWVRKCANAVNQTILQLVALTTRVTAAEAVNTTQDGRLATLETHDTNHEGRIANLETRTAAAFTFTPGSLPASPVEGMTAMDSSDHKLKTWDGSTWQAHW